MSLLIILYIEGLFPLLLFVLQAAHEVFVFHRGRLLLLLVLIVGTNCYNVKN